MRIGIDARLYRSSAAGIGRYSQNLIKNLLAIDNENEYVLFMTPEDKKEFDLPNKNIKIIQVDIPHYSLAEQTKMVKIIEKEKCDLVHFLNFNYPVCYKGKFIVTIHDLTLLFYPDAAKKTNFIKQSAFRYVFKKACKNSSRIIAVSENTKKDIIKTFNIPEAKIKVIYEAADDKKLLSDEKSLENIKHKYHIDEKKIILYVGQFRQHKNIQGLLNAYEILKKKMSVRLVLIGKVTENIKKYIDSKPEIRDTLTLGNTSDIAEESVIMPGFVSDEELAAWYKLADVFVFPSFYEGFGLPGLEAMQAGLPVVASKVTSLPEIYNNAALYFDPLKPDDIADKIEIVLNNKNKKEELIKNGYENIKKYSWGKCAQETLDLYKQIQKSEILNPKS
ncbi:MAG: group 1 glycosyl transferase [Candidatus Berkelbacteria bacterium]|nr:group 1 glycosyl transferase [Candidatus Berkelbacteria bacterium]